MQGHAARLACLARPDDEPARGEVDVASLERENLDRPHAGIECDRHHHRGRWRHGSDEPRRRLVVDRRGAGATLGRPYRRRSFRLARPLPLPRLGPSLPNGGVPHRNERREELPVARLGVGRRVELARRLVEVALRDRLQLSRAEPLRDRQQEPRRPTALAIGDQRLVEGGRRRGAEDRVFDQPRFALRADRLGGWLVRNSRAFEDRLSAD